MELAEHFQLGMEFYFQSKNILLHLWESIKNTKDDVIAGLVASIVLLCEHQNKPKEEVNVHLICKRLGIKMSTIQSQVKRRIFERFKVEGFTTLLKSTDLLKKVMHKLGLIINEKDNPKERTEEDKQIKNNVKDKSKIKVVEKINPDIVELKLGGARSTCNHLKNIGYYFFAFEEKERYPVLMSLKSYDMSNFCTDAVIKGRMPKTKFETNKNNSLFEFELIK